MKTYELAIRKNDLMVEVWWEPGDNEFRATVRDEQTDEGWTGTGDDINDAILVAVAIYTKDTQKQKVA